MTDFRALCAELLSALESEGYAHWVNGPDEDDLCLRARAALAEPGPERPTDEELLEMMPQPFRGDLALVSRIAAHGAGPDIKPGLFRVSLNTGALDYARAVLARWGNPAPLADTYYELELEDVEGEWQAGGSSNSQSDVEREGMRYLQTYAQNGPHKLIIRQHTTQTINEIVHLETQDEPYVKDRIPFA